MGMIVRRFEDIDWGIRSTPPEIRLFCFFVFDDRPSHRPVLELLESSAEWVDGLSATAGIRTFLFARSLDVVEGGPRMPSWMYLERPIRGEERHFLDALSSAQADVYPTTHHAVYVNPALSLAKQFGILPRDLPGLLLFDNLPAASETNAAFIPIAVDSFTSHFESTISEIYSRIGLALKDDKLPGSRDSIVKALASALEPAGENVAPLPSQQQPLATIVTAAEARAILRLKTNNEPYKRESGRRREPRDIKIFISYAREDKQWAQFVYRRLKDANYRPWIDTEDILPGAQWDAAIREALREADFLVFCLSSNSVKKRGYVQREIRIACDLWQEKLDDDIYILPIRFDDCELPDALRRFQWVDLRPPYKGIGWKRILAAIEEGAKRRGIGTPSA